ncbi:MAG: sulfate ABC transporter substrate-binding protein [Cyanobacteriota bacterium]|nr:sulfate ABC transporter substrate-binding protein [Cyanobacteriota bacterium]
MKAVLWLSLGGLTGVGLIASQLAPAPLLSQRNPQKLEVTLVSYAVTRSAYDKIIPKFVAQWKKEKNQTVTFKQSYGGSGSQTRAVIDGLDADIVQLPLESDIKKIEQAGLIKPGWQKEVPNNGVVTRSVIALVTRPGNPKKIKGWSDLARPGVKTITANPKTSGVARWNFMGLWGSVTQTGGSEAKARTFTTQVYNAVPVLAKDAREATDVFYKQKQGDVLLNYENEILLAQAKGAKEPYIIPPVNISIDALVAVVDKNADKKGTQAVASAFAKYLFTPEAQEEFAKAGFRSVNGAVSQKYAGKFPKVPKLYTISAFGGWQKVQDKFFSDGGVFDQIFKAK